MNLDLIAIKPVSAHDNAMIDARPSQEAAAPAAPNSATNNIANQQTSFFSTSPQNQFQKNFFEMQSGVKLLFDEGHIVLNGVNISTYIATCKAYPTQKSKLFLRGIKNRLQHVLKNQANLGVQDAIFHLFAEIDDVLS